MAQQGMNQIDFDFTHEEVIQVLAALGSQLNLNELQHQQQLDIHQQFVSLGQRTTESNRQLKELQEEQQEIVLLNEDWQEKHYQLTQMNQNYNGVYTNVFNSAQSQLNNLQGQINQIETTWNNLVKNHAQKRDALVQQILQIIIPLEQMKSEIINVRLLGWKNKQIGSKKEKSVIETKLSNKRKLNEIADIDVDENWKSLDEIQKWCEELLALIWQIREQIVKIEILIAANVEFDKSINVFSKIEPEIISNIKRSISYLLHSLVSNSLVVEKQPKRVFKKEKKISTSVRFLLGNKFGHHIKPEVKVSIINETQANNLQKNGIIEASENNINILNSKGTMEYHQDVTQSFGRMSVKFINLKLVNFKRAELRGNINLTDSPNTVMDEKFCFLFQSHFKLGGDEFEFNSWTLSLPVVVTVHENQKAHAKGNIIWDNSFAVPGRNLFEVERQVRWSQVSAILNKKFCQAGLNELNEDHLYFLACKAMNNPNLPLDDYKNCLVSYEQFNKDRLPGRNFTFYQWFYKIYELVKYNLKAIWNDNSIIGFVSKERVKYMISNGCAPGTFLLRFSDSELGAIVIAYVEKDILMLGPYKESDMSIRSLADIIDDLPQLVNLYPNKSKEIAFGDYFTQKKDECAIRTSPYVKPVLKACIP